ncbi:hypothetical protein LNV08_06465 [Paucibacter sp. TC2R-5]|uniref:hypothetical protein n=1 Tax=Paucibacter sp. TC2R-5 TaxID=2893555 RepID=UPI0021E37746|nr:hypothetical protein [Paucibacter sp. TC2R-5]MCV2358618.1 hypothetical protein [Paucibacter sp. TC2R-5]
MNSLIYAPMVSPADGTPHPQSGETPAWTLPILAAGQTVCSGNCDQGRRCNCTLSSNIYCENARAESLADQQEQQGAALLIQMFQLLCGIMLMCSLAWLVA